MLTHSEFLIFNNDLELYDSAIVPFIIAVILSVVFISVLINIIIYPFGMAVNYPVPLGTELP